LVTEAEVSRARSELEQRQAATEAMRLAVGRIAAGSRLEASDRQVEVGSLQRQLAALEGEVRVTEADAARLEHEIDRRTVRAGVDGEVAELSTLATGSVVKEGDRLGTVLPHGRLRAVAEVPAREALGVVHVGQIGRLRLAGLPWAQHGTVGAVVTRVASEIREGRLRVELELAEGSRLPLQHGLPGTVEIEVERASPALLLLRSAGKALERPAPAAASATPASAPTEDRPTDERR
jgi:multidrug resistance efflux pump